MSTTFRQPISEKQLQMIENWMRELEFYESEIGSCVWSLEQFTPDLSLPHLKHAAHRFQGQFEQQRTRLQSLNAKLRRLHRRLAKADRLGQQEELLERSFSRLSGEVEECRSRFNTVLPNFDNFLRSCQA